MPGMVEGLRLGFGPYGWLGHGTDQSESFPAALVNLSHTHRPQTRAAFAAFT